MTNVVSDITGTVQRVLDYPVFRSSGITVASLLELVILFVLVVVGGDDCPPVLPYARCCGGRIWSRRCSSRWPG